MSSTFSTDLDKSFYKIIFEDRQEGAKFFQARTRYKPDKR